MSDAKFYQVENSRSKKVIGVGYFVEMQNLARQANTITSGSHFIVTDATSENIAQMKDNGGEGFGLIAATENEDTTLPDAPRTTPSESDFDYGSNDGGYDDDESPFWLHTSHYKKNHRFSSSLTVKERVQKYLKGFIKKNKQGKKSKKN